MTREKYSELKLLGNFAKVSPSYLVTTPGGATNATYTDTSDLTVTPLLGTNSSASFVIRSKDGEDCGYINHGGSRGSAFWSSCIAENKNPRQNLRCYRSGTSDDTTKETECV